MFNKLVTNIVIIIISITSRWAGCCGFYINSLTLSVDSWKSLTRHEGSLPLGGISPHSWQIQMGCISPGFCMCFGGEFIAFLHIPFTLSACHRLSPASARPSCGIPTHPDGLAAPSFSTMVPMCSQPTVEIPLHHSFIFYFLIPICRSLNHVPPEDTLMS